MRPLVGGDALNNPRKQNSSEPTVTTPLAVLEKPTTFFLASESMLDRSRDDFVGMNSEHNFGVQSLEDTIRGSSPQLCGEEETWDHELPAYGRKRRPIERSKTHVNRTISSESIGRPSRSDSASLLPAYLQQQHQATPSMSQPLTPISFASPTQGSSPPSSPISTSTHSLRPSDEELTDDGASQAVVSSGDEDNSTSPLIHEGAPQLIMPSIKIPSRKPFTEKGKNMGRLKVLLVGKSGAGKSSLIKSIVQLCEDIVHIDPLPSNPSMTESWAEVKPKNKPENAKSNSTKQITEIYASTRAYPPWWSDLEESRVLRRRKSMGDTVLERNLCFVDTPGYRHGTSAVEHIDPIIQYIETQIMKTTSLASMDSGDLLALLGGNGGSQVDVVFYLISQHLNHIDIDFIKRLSPLTSVIPVISKADLLSNAEVQALKESVVAEMQSAELRIFTFGSGLTAPDQPYTVCSAVSNDAENMDASLLMSPDYIEPLLPSELIMLVEKVFDRDGVSWLRHSTAKKMIRWRGTSQIDSRVISDPVLAISGSKWNHPAVSPGMSASTLSPALASSQVSLINPQNRSSYLQAKLSDHIQREENLANIRLANWAGEFQRSLQNERLRYEALARGERAIWLTQQLSECVSEGTLIAMHTDTAAAAPSEKLNMSSRDPAFGSLSHRGLNNLADPLGLIRWNEIMRSGGWVAFQLVGGFGVLGAVAVWVLKNWSTSIDEPMGWAWNWLGGVE